MGLVLAGMVLLAPGPACAREVSSEHYQFTMDVPDHWLGQEGLAVRDVFSLGEGGEDPATKGRVFAYYPPDHEQSGISTALVVREYKFAPHYRGLSEKQLRQRYADMFREIDPDIELTNFKVLDDGENDALRFDLLIPSEGGLVRQARYLTSGPKFNYILMLSCPEDKYRQTRPLFEEVIESLGVPLPVHKPAYASPAGRLDRNKMILPAFFCAVLMGVFYRSWRTNRAMKEE
jgi:hypothetical protein